MKLLILGGTGFLGKNLKNYFKEEYQVLAPEHNQLNLLDSEVLRAYLEKHRFDIVLNAVGSSLEDSSLEYFHDRFRMFFNLARCSQYYGKQIYFGSGAEFGKDLPIIEADEDMFDQRMPRDNYGFFMHTCCKYAALSDNIYNYRLFGLFGPYENYKRRFISNAICKALLDFPITIRQDCVFDYLHVDDLCRFVNYGITHELKRHEYNVTSGTRHSLLDLAKMVLEFTNKEVPIFIGKDGMGNEYSGCNKRIVRESSIIPAPIEAGIKNLVLYYKENINFIEKYDLLYHD